MANTYTQIHIQRVAAVSYRRPLAQLRTCFAPTAQIGFCSLVTGIWLQWSRANKIYVH
jgi:hypothetical protein